MQVDRLTAVFAPVYPNPYQHLLAAALRDQNVEVIFSEHAPPDAGWLRTHAGDVQILHLHWLSGLYMQRLLTPLRILRFVQRVRLARSLGYGIVWTAHNVLPHKRPIPILHEGLRRFMVAQAGAIIVHCEYGRNELRRRFGAESGVTVIPIGRYPSPGLGPGGRSAARSALDITPEQFVTIAAGNIIAYKGTMAIAESFLQVAGPNDLAIIAGRNRDSGLVQHLQALATVDPRLRVLPGFVSEEDMAHYHLAADAAVFAFREVLTSSSVVLALGYGLPVIVPRLGCLPELVTEEAGILYDAGDAEALAEAMRAIKRRDHKAMRSAALSTAAALDWDDIAAQTAEVYRSLVHYW